MDDDYSQTLKITATTTSALSMLGSLSVLWTYFNLPRFRRKELGERMVMIESVLDFFASLPFALSAAFLPKKGESPSPACICQAWFVQFFLAAVCWNAVMAGNFYALVVLRKNARRLCRKLKYELAFLCLFTATIACLLLFMGGGYPGVYGDATLWCWITVDHVAAQFGAFYSVVLLCWGICIYVLVKVGQSGSIPLIAVGHARDDERWHSISSMPRTLTAQMQAAAAAKESAAAVRSRLSKYLAAFVWIWTFGLVNRVASAVTHDIYGGDNEESIFALYFLHVLFVPLQGFFNALIYHGFVDDLLAWCWSLNRHAQTRHRRQGSDGLDAEGRWRSASPERLRDTRAAAGGWNHGDVAASVLTTTESLADDAAWSSATADNRVGRRSLFVTTFNLGESSLSPDDVSAWLPPGHDVYVIGVQECLDLGPLRNLMLKHLNGGGGGGEQQPLGLAEEREEDETTTTTTSTTTGAFVMYCREIGSTNTSLGFHGMIALTVFLRRDEVDGGVASVESHPVVHSVSMGQPLLGGVRLPNKGGVGISVKYHDSTLAFLTAHFASDSGGRLQPRTRNAQTMELLSSCVLTADDTGSDVHLAHHHTFCLGDFNYRIADFHNPEEILNILHDICVAECSEEDCSGSPGGTNWRTRRWNRLFLAAAAADSLAAEARGEGLGGDLPWAVEGSDGSISSASVARWAPLLQYDELTRARELGAIFADFQEMPIAFPPTFRRQRGPRGDPGDYTSRQALLRAYVVDLKSAGGGAEEENGDFISGALFETEPQSSTAQQKSGEIKDEPVDSVGHEEERGGSAAALGFRNKSLRPPSWTDRVVVHSLHDARSQLELEIYESTDAVDVSDHRPVALVAVLAVDDAWEKSAVAMSVERKRRAFFRWSRGLAHSASGPLRTSVLPAVVSIPEVVDRLNTLTQAQRKEAAFHVRVSVSSPRLLGGRLESSQEASERINRALYETPYYAAPDTSKQRQRSHQTKVVPEELRTATATTTDVEAGARVVTTPMETATRNVGGLKAAVSVVLVFPIPAEDLLLQHRKVFESAAEAIPGTRARQRQDKRVAFKFANSSGWTSVSASRSEVLGNSSTVLVQDFFQEGGCDRKALVKISDVVPSRGMHALLKFVDSEGMTLAAGCLCLAGVVNAHLNQAHHAAAAAASAHVGSVPTSDATSGAARGPVPVEVEVPLSLGGRMLGKLFVNVSCEKALWEGLEE